MTDKIISAISHTLIHSLWQGAVLSALVGLVMTGTRRSSAAKRYGLLVAAMALFVLTVSVTFVSAYNRANIHGTMVSGEAVNHTIRVSVVGDRADMAPLSVTEMIGGYFNRYSAWIVAVWLLVVCGRCAQLITGLQEVYDLRRKDASIIGSEWEQRVKRFCSQLGIKRCVGIIQSARITTPMVIGHLKPLILIPVGMLTSLTAEEAEAILWHELAHIRRADYLVNLLQSLMEIIFFFNPAVLWLSALIKTERENCCDDIALSQSSKASYLKALVACEEYKNTTQAFAMALKGSNGGLKNRVMRIIVGKNSSLNNREKSLLAIYLLTIIVFTATLTHAEKLQQLIGKAGKISTEKKMSVKQQPVTLAKLLPQPVAITETKATQTVSSRITTKPVIDSVSAGSVGTAISNEPPVSQPATVAQTAKTAPVARIAEPAKVATPAKQVKTTREYERTSSIISDMIADGIITSEQGLSFKIGTNEFVVNYQKQPEAVYQKYRAKYVPKQDQQANGWDWLYDFDNEKYAQLADIYRDAADAYQARQTNYQPSHPYKNPNTKAGDAAAAITTEMIKDGIITSGENLSFKISNHVFIVNGKKQPQNIYQKYLAKFGSHPKNADWNWEHSNP